MSELECNKADFIEIINELVPSYQVAKITSVIESDNLTEVELEQLGMSLTGEKKDISTIIPTGAPNEGKNSLWSAIKKEVFDYLCTASQRYSEERKEAKTTVKTVVTILAGSIATAFNITIGVVSAAVTIALFSALKIGKNAWCEINKEPLLN